MRAKRPAYWYWAKAEAERRIVAAGRIDLATLSREAKGTLAWLVGGDTPRIDGVVELLEAACRAGQKASGERPDPVELPAADRLRARLDEVGRTSVERRLSGPELGL